ncbi:MAG TPA: MarR family transcriptional regulator [Propionibacteriaceae bacterium]|jgi:DNA-binding MarR family transcriptional regulator|nr:MarR family transcriptional regulator [Propionibacteriaceae bacterium]
MEDNLQQLGEELISTAARMVRWAPREQGFQISLAAARLLARLHDNGPTRISDLATAERCSQPTITNHVKRLEAAELVAREVDPHDGRVCIISLTDSGMGELLRMRAAIGAGLEPYLARLSEPDRRTLAGGLEVMQRLMTIKEPVQ